MKRLFAPQEGKEYVISYGLQKPLSRISRLKIAVNKLVTNLVERPHDLGAGVRTEYDVIGSQSTIRPETIAVQREQEAVPDALRDRQLKRDMKRYRDEQEAREQSEPYWTPKAIVNRATGEEWQINVKHVTLLQPGQTINSLLKTTPNNEAKH